MIIKPLKALALLAGTLTHGLRHFAPILAYVLLPLSWALVATA